MVRRARALHAWDAASGAAADDLHFTAGQEFELVSESVPGSGWYTGILDGTKGIFPGNFVEVIEVPADTAVAAPVAVPGRAAAPVATEVWPAPKRQLPSQRRLTSSSDGRAAEQLERGNWHQTLPASPHRLQKPWHGTGKMTSNERQTRRGLGGRQRHAPPHWSDRLTNRRLLFRRKK